jgi:hypothetical protein
MRPRRQHRPNPAITLSFDLYKSRDAVLVKKYMVDRPLRGSELTSRNDLFSFHQDPSTGTFRIDLISYEEFRKTRQQALEVVLFCEFGWLHGKQRVSPLQDKHSPRAVGHSAPRLCVRAPPLYPQLLECNEGVGTDVHTLVRIG